MTTLSVNTRAEFGKAVKSLRQKGKIPGVVYGHGISPLAVAVEANALDKVYRQVGESTLVDLTVDGGKAVKVLIQDVQLDPLKSIINHVDFNQVRMDEKLTIDIPLKFVGEAPAVKEFGGIFVKTIDHLKVECLPQDLVHEIEVDTLAMNELNKPLTISMIKIPAGLKVLAQEDEIIATVIPPRSEAELAELKTTPVAEDVAKVEKVEKEKKEEAAEETK